MEDWCNCYNCSQENRKKKTTNKCCKECNYEKEKEKRQNTENENSSPNTEESSIQK